MELIGDVKVYRPGDPEFDAIAATITPLHKIRKGVSVESTYISAETTDDNVLRRKESVNELKGQA